MSLKARDEEKGRRERGRPLLHVEHSSSALTHLPMNSAALGNRSRRAGCHSVDDERCELPEGFKANGKKTRWENDSEAQTNDEQPASHPIEK